MNNMMMLRQARAGIKAQIDNSPDTITVKRPVLVSDGFGGYTPGTATTDVTLRGRLSHERTAVQALELYPSGFDTGFKLFILVDHLTTLSENETITARGMSFRVGPVDGLIKFGGVIGFEAGLTPA